ncbi:nitrous oxide-stimulated promoter family protein [bacterium]|nr:nitrous oxide-stimulated promoter family protein [bacterium]
MPGAKEREFETLKKFVTVYCENHHSRAEGEAVCGDCGELLEYARGRLGKCPYDPKPKCKDCPTHCYNPRYRQRVREVMKFSGMYFVKRGRVDWLVKYFMS